MTHRFGAAFPWSFLSHRPILAAKYIPPRDDATSPTNAQFRTHSMPPKGKKGQTADKAKPGDEEREEPLQAVVGAACARACVCVCVWKQCMLISL